MTGASDTVFITVMVDGRIVARRKAAGTWSLGKFTTSKPVRVVTLFGLDRYSVVTVTFMPQRLSAFLGGFSDEKDIPRWQIDGLVEGSDVTIRFDNPIFNVAALQ